MRAPESPLKVLIVDDHEFTRTGLKYSLEEHPHIQIVGEACNGQEALILNKNSQPDIVLMDIGMPVMNGIFATQQIKADYPDTKIIVLTSRQLSEEIYASLAAGADAYCIKDITTDKLLYVMETVSDGAIWLDPAIARVVTSALPQISPEKCIPKRQAYNVELTDREREVLNCIAQGKSNKDIADTLHLSIHTVKTYVSSLIYKLAVDDRTQVALKAIQDGLV